MRLGLKISSWAAAIVVMLPLISFAIYDLFYFQHHRVEITRLIQVATPEESEPPPLIVQLVRISTGENVDWLVTRLIIDNLNICNKPKSMIGRHIESFLWLQLVRIHLTKHEQLTLYLAQVHTGKDSKGFSYASHALFNKPLSGLNVEEAATIADLPNAPSTFAKRPDLLTKRREYLLSKLDTSF